MNKRKFLRRFIAPVTCIALGCTVSHAQTYYYEYESSLATTNLSLGSNVSDLSYDATSNKMVVTCNVEDTTLGQSSVLVARYDPNAGATVTGFQLNNPSLRPVRTYSTGGYNYVLTDYIISGQHTVALIKMNATSGLVSFSKYWKIGTTYDLRATDIDYDGGGNLYIVGTYDDHSQTDLFILKVTTAGVLVSLNMIGTPSVNQGAYSVQYYSSTEMYIGGYYGSTSTTNNSGWLVVYNPTANTSVSATVMFYSATWNHFLSNFCVKRYGSYIYAMGSSGITIDGAPDLLYVGKFDLSRNPVSHTTYTEGAFLWQNKFNIINNQIIATGEVDVLFTTSPGYANLVFDLYTGFVTGQLYPASPAFCRGASSAGATATTVYTCGMFISGGNIRMLRVRAASANVTVNNCPNPFIVPYYGDEHTVSFPKIVPVPSGEIEGTLSVPVNAVSFFNITNCFYDPYAQRLADQSAIPAAAETLTLYPNPASQTLHLQTGEGMHIDQLEIADVTGRIVYRSQEAEIAAEISLDGFQPGIYLVRARMSDGQILTEKFVKE